MKELRFVDAIILGETNSNLQKIPYEQSIYYSFPENTTFSTYFVSINKGYYTAWRGRAMRARGNRVTTVLSHGLCF